MGKLATSLNQNAEKMRLILSAQIPGLNSFPFFLFFPMTISEKEDLPEDIILNIFSRLPVKSLIRFSSVSRRLHFVIFSDPKFAQSQITAARHHKTLASRLLVSTDAPLLESLHLDHSSSFEDPSSVRKLSLPFQHSYVRLLGSCNGLVFIASDDKFFYIWNPSLGFFKQLPDPGFSSNRNALAFYGVGYLSATDDYKVLVATVNFGGTALEVEMFSLRTRVWKRIEFPGVSDVELDCVGILWNNALHWLNYCHEDEMVFVNLEEEVFRRMRLPSFDADGKSFSNVGVCGGCLCVSRFPEGACDSFDIWVMRDYESWIMLFRLRVHDRPELHSYDREFLVVESSTVAAICNAEGLELIRIDHKEGERVGRYVVTGNQIYMIEYEESLLWIGSYYPETKKTG